MPTQNVMPDTGEVKKEKPDTGTIKKIEYVQTPLGKRKKVYVGAPCGNRIITHKVHSYDEHGRVIVVDGETVDLQALIDNEATISSLPAIIKKYNETKDFRYLQQGNADYGDVSGFEGNLNEIAAQVDVAGNKVSEALAAFNALAGTNLTIEEYTRMVESGALKDFIENIGGTDNVQE